MSLALIRAKTRLWSSVDADVHCRSPPRQTCRTARRVQAMISNTAQQHGREQHTHTSRTLSFFLKNRRAYSLSLLAASIWLTQIRPQKHRLQHCTALHCSAPPLSVGWNISSSCLPPAFFVAFIFDLLTTIEQVATTTTIFSIDTAGHHPHVTSDRFTFAIHP